MNVYVSVGSNINREKNIHSCILSMQNSFGKLMVSPIYESEAYGFNGEDFLNLVICFQVDDNENIQRVLDTLRDIEMQHGRKRGEHKFSSRTLDLDLLLFGNNVLIDQGLDIPRAEIQRYAFVLKPLADIAPTLLHPVLQVAFQELWQQFSQQNPQQAATIRLLASSPETMRT